MTLPGEAGLDELEPTRVRLHSPAQREPAPSCASAPADWELETDLFGAMDRAAPPRASLADVSEIKVDRSQRVFVAVGSRSRGVVLTSMLGACAVALGLAYVFIGGLASPFDLTWIGRSSGHRVLDREPASPAHPAQAASSPAPVSDVKGDHLQITHRVIAPPDRQEPAKSPEHPDLFSSSAMTRWNPSMAGRPPARFAPSATRQATPMRPHPTSITAAAATPQPETRITTPVPETRPTTIEGWTLREVINGTAVVEGPGGSFRVARGDSLPGAGRVLAIFRWGNRLMVATSAGLISTP